MQIRSSVAAISAMDGVSLVACIWIIFSVCRLKRNSKRRLFPRMMLVLAASDAIFAISRLGYSTRNYGINKSPPLGLELVLFWSFDATVLGELSIVGGFACQMFGSTRGGGCPSWCVWWPWAVAAPIATMQTMFSERHEAHWLGSEMSEMFIACACFPVALVVFASLIYRARSSSNAVVRRSWHRAAAYVANFLVTFAPLIVWSYTHKNDSAMPVPRFLAILAMHSNGLVNALAYFAQSRYNCSDLLSTDCTRTGPSLVVRFEDVCVEDGKNTESAFEW